MKQSRKCRRAMQRREQKQETRNKKEFLVKALATSATALALTVFVYTANVHALPQDGTVTAGSGTITQSQNTTTVTQNTDKLAINWQSYNIGSNETVFYIQPTGQAIALNRITGSDPSAIYGRLTANGRVFLINPNGVLFAPGAQVNVGGLVASTLNLSDTDFLAGNYNFRQQGDGAAVINQGTITATPGGFVVLAGNTVTNNGTISSEQGTVVLGAGSQIAMDLPGDGSINLEVDQAALNAAITNGGVIITTGGRSILTGKAQDAVLTAVVNNTGIVEAQSLSNHNGTIILDGGSNGLTQSSGILDASGKDVGETGGTVKILGNQVTLNSGAAVDVSGDQGGGTALIGGNSHGVGPEQNAATTTINSGVTIDADAITNGNGGKVVVWADDTTQYNGYISAQGGLFGGDGGNVEVSGKLKLNYDGLANLLAPNGSTGNLLLDPNDFTIAAAGGDITGATLGSQLNVANVTILSNSGATSGTGNINVNDTVTWLGPHNLTLNAANDVIVTQVITPATDYNVALRADYGATGTGTVTFSGAGAIQLSGAGTALIYYNVPGTMSVTVNGGPVTVPDYDNPISFSAYVTGGNGVTAYMLINNLNELQAIVDSRNLTGNYALGANIDASATATWNSGAGFVPIGSNTANFTGNFDGLGYTISNLTINRPGSDYVGLFGWTGPGTPGIINNAATNAVVKNLGLVGGNITGGNYVGSLVGYCNSGTGVVFENCYNTGNVSGHADVGGLQGYSNTNLLGCYNFGTVNGTGDNIGGLVGEGGGGGLEIGNYNTGAVTGVNNVGGVVGYASDNVQGYYISYAYNTGAVSGAKNVGGVVGNTGYLTIINNTYNTGAVSGSSNAGGLAGLNTTINYFGNSYWDINTSGTIKGIGSGSTAGVGLTSQGTPDYNSALTQSSYSGFDFGSYSWNVWRIYEGYTYPLLKYFLTPMTVAANSVTTTYNGTAYVSAPANITYTVGGSTISSPGHVYGDLSYGSPTNAGTYYLGALYSDQQGYDITYSSGSKLTINKAPLTVSTSPVTKTYDGTTAAAGIITLKSGTLYNGDTLSGGTFAFTDANAGVGNKTVTVSGVVITDAASRGNYTISYASNTTSTINPELLTVSTGSVTKTYDGTTTATGSAILTNGTLYNGDTLSGGTIAFSDPNAGNNKTVTVTGVSVTHSGNYTISYTDNNTSIINPEQITVSTGNVIKTYDGTTTASGSLILTSGTLYNGDTLSGGTFAFSDPNAGSGDKTVTISGVNVTNSGNYSISYANNTNSTITPKDLTISAGNSVNKIYDGTTAANLANDNFGLSGLIPADNDSVTISGSGTYNSPNVNGATLVTIDSVSLSGANAGNYIISSVPATIGGTITAKPLTITANNDSIIYTGQAYSGGNGVTYSGFADGESSSVLSGNITYGGTSQGAVNIGSYTITPSGLSSSNYAITYQNGTLKIVTQNTGGIDSAINYADNFSSFEAGENELEGIPSNDALVIAASNDQPDNQGLSLTVSGIDQGIITAGTPIRNENTREKTPLILVQGRVIKDGDLGVPGVKIIAPDGRSVVTDASGRYEFANIDPKYLSTGERYIIKVDQESIPAGMILTTENTKSVILTKEITTEINFEVTAPVTASNSTPGTTTNPVVIDHNKGFNNGSILLDITGTGFSKATVVSLESKTGISIHGKIINIDSAKLQCFFDLKDQTAGIYDLKVTNADGNSFRVADAFTIREFKADMANAKTLKPVYFNVNKSAIRPDQLANLAENLAFLQQNPNLMITLGGYADSRGSYDYNLRLSERRANMIKQYLIDHNIAADRITIYAFGSKSSGKPVTETELQKERRVEIICYDEE